MPLKVTAKQGDTLCGIAIDNGFLNCLPLRAEPSNGAFLNGPLKAGDTITVPDRVLHEESGSTDTTHKFKLKSAPKASIRFVHGSPDRKYLDDTTTTVLNISNHVTDKGGLDDNVPFPNQPGFHQPGHDDPDTFKVEVVDPAAGASVKVTLEALRRSILADGTFQHVPFPGGGRKLNNLDCPKVRSGVAYRSRYLRLVTAEADKNAIPDQTLFVSDLADGGSPEVEILDQAVRGTYVLQNCPAGGAAQCSVSVQVPVGSDSDPRKPRARMRLAIHILKQTPGGTPVVQPADADRRVNKWWRRVYAQAGIAPLQVQSTREVDPVSNLAAIGEFDPARPTVGQGVAAAGDGTFSFRINAQGLASQIVGPLASTLRDTPLQTANKLAALVQAPYTASVTENPARFVDPPNLRSADILITAPGVNVTIDNEASTDTRQNIRVGRPNPLSLQSWDGTNFLVGSLEQRAILKNYDTGEDRIDIVVAGTLSSGNRGEAMMSGHQIDPLRRAIAPIRFSAFLAQITMDGTDSNPFSFPHECGHVSMEVIHATGRANQLMTSGTTGADNVAGTKRIREGLQAFDGPARSFRQMPRLRTEGAILLDGF